MAAAPRDFTSWLDTGKNSDVQLRIVINEVNDSVKDAEEQEEQNEQNEQEEQNEQQEQEERPAKRSRSSPAAQAGSAQRSPGERRVAAVLALHSVILEEASGWARALLGSEESLESQQRVLDLVLSDEADVAAVKLLLRAIYGADPEAQVQDFPLATLLQVLRLADRIQVPRVVAAAGGRFTTAEPLDWDVAQSIWALPTGCEENAAYMTAFAAAAATLQQELGDLEVAMLDAARREQLLGLPFKALQCLLESSATRVFSENTVFLVCDMWLRRRGGGEAEQQLQLARLVRLPHVTSLYLLTVVGQSAWLASRVPWHIAAAWAHAPGPLRIGMLRHNPILARAKAWRLAPRPYSSVKELVIEWGLSLVELQRIHEAVQAGVRGANRTVSEPQYWGGFKWRLHLCALILGGGVSFEMVLVPQGVVVEGAVATADVTMGRGGLVPRESGVEQCTFADVSGRKGYIYKGVFKGCMQKAWSEGPWRAAGLVGEDGHVRVRATITNVQ